MALAHHLLATDLPLWEVVLFGTVAGLLAGGMVLTVGVFLLSAKKVRRHGRKFAKKGALAGDAATAQVPVPLRDRDIFVQGGSLERRVALRRTGNPIAVLISDAKTEVEPIIGYVLNRSTGGLGLLVREPIEPGTILTIRAKNAPAEIPWVRTEVRSCRGDADEWELGCRFERTPPWNVLLLFG